jgi:exopolysaccharide biosynthesis polyprenyl glycosylphosphotransferase
MLVGDAPLALTGESTALNAESVETAETGRIERTYESSAPVEAVSADGVGAAPVLESVAAIAESVVAGAVSGSASTLELDGAPLRLVRDAKDAVVDSRPAPSVNWARRYQMLLIAVDAASAALACLLASLVRFGAIRLGAGEPRLALGFTVGLPVLWVVSLATARAYEARFVGVGTCEFERMIKAFFRLVAVVAFLLFATKSDLSRELILTALVLTVGIDAGARLLMRNVLRAWWASGNALTALLAVGEPDSVVRFAERLRSERHAGARVVGACVPRHAETVGDGLSRLEAAGVPVYGDVNSVREAAAATRAGTVAVLAGSLETEQLRRVSWQLEGTETHLIVSSGLSDVADRRLHLRPIGGMALVYVDGARFTGAQRILKGIFDRVVAATSLLVLSPVLVVIAALIKATSHGPVFFRQTRVGKDGTHFQMVKFRSMCVDAERRLSELADDNEGAGLLFKLRDDPRVTRIGRVLRRYSLDELPQLFNVFGGSMSLVGPRPPLPHEVAHYGEDVHRRLLVKPGITGVWQVSGRSDLSWEESVRMDLNYVENWSLLLDLSVLLKTVSAVAKADGAY